MKIKGTDIKDFVVIFGAGCSGSEKTAAYELAKYIEKSCGVKLQVSDDSCDESDYEIVIGHTNRTTDKEYRSEEYEIYTEGTKLCIVGGKVRGTLYGVYSFLEEYMGWRFYAAGVEETVFTEEILINDIYSHYDPVFEYRDVYYFCAFDPEWSAKQKVNGCVTRKLGSELGGGVEYAGEHFVHTFNVFMPISEYYAEHPEYFALHNGERDGRHLYTQLCLTNPDVLRIMTEQVIKRLEKDPGARIISVSQDDSFVGDSYCRCEECERVNKEEGSPMGSLLRFVNSIADSVRERFPEVAIDTLAYQHTFRPPLITKPRDNVIIRLCTWNPELAKKHEEIPHISNALRIWRENCKRIYIWDYTANFSDYIVTLPNFENLRPNINLFVRNNVRGVFAQGNYQSVSGEFGELKSYLLAKLLWDPEMSEEEYNRHMDEFLKGYYGEGWTYIKQYISYVQDIVKGSDGSMRGNPTQILPADKFDYDLAASWWDKAEELAKDQDSLTRIRRSRCQLIHWKLFSEGVSDLNDYYSTLRSFGITCLNEGGNVPVPFTS